MSEVKKLLILGFVWPEPKSSAAGGRMMQLISLFKEEGYDITFASPAMDSIYMADLSAVNVAKVSISLNSSSFDAFIKELGPTVVLFDRFMMEEQFGWRVADNCPEAIRVLDTEDLHCLRLARQKAFKEQRQFDFVDLFKEDIAKREIASILRCDLSLIISEYEMEILEYLFKIDKTLLCYLPFLLQIIDYREMNDLPSFEEREHFIFIGNFLHEPNWNAVQYLKESIWPLIRDHFPEAVLQVFGAYPSQKVLQLHNVKQGFHIMGRAADAERVVKKARVVLAPLRFGAGLKGKLVEAMLCGTASVTTSIGAEGMCGELRWNGVVEDAPQEFAKAAVQLYQNKESWLAAQKNGIEIVNQRFSKDLFLADFKLNIAFLLENLKEHRLSNFMGAMLQHHTLSSTKYMSRWIEEKNKVR